MQPYDHDEDYEEDINQEAAVEEDEEVTQDDASLETEDEDLDEETLASPSKRATARMERERLRLQAKQKKELLEKMRSEQNNSSSAGEAERARHRLQFLLRQAEIFQHFVPEKEKNKTVKQKARGRGARDEYDEDEELLRDEEDEGERAGHRLQVQPSIITGGTLREYQMQGLNWLIHLYDNGINGILADEMGLGKTLQTISLCAYLYEYRGITGPHIVIVPKSTLHNWCNEFRRFCPTIRVIKFHGNAEERNYQKESVCAPGKFDVVVTSYEMVIKEKNHFRKFHWRYIIIDEAHRIKNENSMLSRVVRMLRTNYRLLITGTPLQNNLHELWALLNFLLPEVFASSEKFEEWFSLGDGGKEKEAEVVQQLHKVLRPFLLRRVKSDVERSLPPKKETILKIGMTEMQRKWYAGLLQKDIDALNGGSDRSKLLNVVMQLRKCCNHPYLFQGAEPGPPFVTGEHLVENSGKMVLLDRLLPKLKERQSRVLIFSQMTRMLDILEDYCLFRGHQYCRIDGNTSGDDREYMIDEFNRDGSEKFVFLLSTRAGGLGINLATADIVVLYDSDWNPQMDLQAMDRAHRIGQKKEVQVFRFCTENSIEEKVIEKAYKKLRLDALVIQQGRLTENSSSKVNKEDLLSMVRYGAELVFSSDASSVTDADIEAIIQKGEKDTKALNDKMQQFTDNAMAFTLDGGMVYDFKDDEMTEAPNIDLKTIIGNNWVDPPKRERKRVANYSESEYYKNAMKAGTKERASGPRLPKMPQLQDFQFYNTKRLTELFEKQNMYEVFQHQQQQKESQLKGQGASEEAVAQALAPTPDDPQPLSEEELAEKDRLLEDGFNNWSRRDFNAFVRACEKYGRQALTQIAAEIDGKTEEEVRQYAAVFWARYKELNDWEKIYKNIERGEQKIQRQQDITNAIASKLERYKNPWQELKIQYGANKGKAYTEEEDRFILCMVHKLGYGNWDDLKAEIRKSWRFRFDWFFKSRTPQELARRCDTLIRLIEKENEDAAGGGAGGEGAAAEKKPRATGERKPRATPGAAKEPGAAGAPQRKRKPTAGTPAPVSDSGTPPPPAKKAKAPSAPSTAAAAGKP
mmetsp:Transcript_40687/g.90456  ORF Transcript_40687/g.90456 Transcript_40687/m.90456 type:complete len:1088 (-) Transcript_40687:511-3774(-)|eukprot:CAMPEP_0202902436 /NCGR_PEP_ID=MMETSP1392-20130828/16849_1 /ASSEMBLY_ACC=CAM_ASM_000868 /TAXON_ID=225041 /ORGANISM="Chlamydomonas chlamydogama, Strain SAG 11-48b" /LENGTH=1087 /DNA_ID=CAMNT_0049589197 /DNA_START=146 /DNA_END=3409 /DNA_ORIENTATION=+